MKALVAFFSASGTTAAVAEAIAKETGAEFFEIRPEKPYTDAELKWTNPLARCNREKIGKKDVPIAEEVKGFAAYDLVFLGFPIWYYGAPNVIQTFCKGYDWRGKKLALFATSGGSDIGRTVERLKPYLSGDSEIVGAEVFHSAAEAANWAKGIIGKNRGLGLSVQGFRFVRAEAYAGSNPVISAIECSINATMIVCTVLSLDAIYVFEEPIVSVLIA